MFPITSFQNYQSNAFPVRKPIFAGNRGLMLKRQEVGDIGDVFVSGTVAVPEADRITMVAEQPVTALLSDDLTSHEIC